LTPATAESAIALQQELWSFVSQEDDYGIVQTVAEVDVEFEEDDRMDIFILGAVDLPAILEL
jgi:deoxyinosine 3'endonuclease (endonuclease V)